jgi:hypothetical protein
MEDVFDIFGLTEGGDIIYYLLQEEEVKYAHADIQSLRYDLQQISIINLQG